jgi:hypothetical protein
MCADVRITLAHISLETADHVGQTYEGGISGKPDAEAHGAYAFCALGCLSILDSPHRIIPRYAASTALSIQDVTTKARRSNQEY